MSGHNGMAHVSFHNLCKFAAATLYPTPGLPYRITAELTSLPIYPHPTVVRWTGLQ